MVAMRFGPHMYAVLPFHCAAWVARKSLFYTIDRSRRGAVRAVRGFLRSFNVSFLANATGVASYAERMNLPTFRQIFPDRKVQSNDQIDQFFSLSREK